MRARGPLAAVLAAALAASAGPVRAGAGPDAAPGAPCLDSLDAVAGVRYAAAADTGSGGSGRTVFHLDQTNHFTYTVATVPRGESLDVVLRPRAEMTLHPWHVVELPALSRDSTARRTRLLRALHDYVAVSQDGRVALLVQWLVAHLPPLPCRAARGTTVRGPFAARVIGAAMSARYAAVVRVVEFNYARLDSLSRHGQQPLPDREAFFAGLYDRAGLVRAGFRYLADVESLLVQPRYAGAPRPHCGEGG